MDWISIIGVLGLGYVALDSFVYIIMREKTLAYWRKKEPNQICLYSYLPLVNIPLAIYNKIKYGAFIRYAKGLD